MYRKKRSRRHEMLYDEASLKKLDFTHLAVILQKAFLTQEENVCSLFKSVALRNVDDGYSHFHNQSWYHIRRRGDSKTI